MPIFYIIFRAPNFLPKASLEIRLQTVSLDGNHYQSLYNKGASNGKEKMRLFHKKHPLCRAERSETFLPTLSFQEKREISRLMKRQKENPSLTLEMTELEPPWLTPREEMRMEALCFYVSCKNGVKSIQTLRENIHKTPLGKDYLKEFCNFYKSLCIIFKVLIPYKILWD
jgi:hypothetical protein